MPATMTGEEVAREFLRHPEPDSAAAQQMLRRLRAAGLPCVTTRAGGLYFRDQVDAWLRAQAELGAAPRNRPAAAGRRGGRRRPLASTALDERIRELEAELAAR